MKDINLKSLANTVLNEGIDRCNSEQIGRLLTTFFQSTVDDTFTNISQLFQLHQQILVLIHLSVPSVDRQAKSLRHSEINGPALRCRAEQGQRRSFAAHQTFVATSFFAEEQHNFPVLGRSQGTRRCRQIRRRNLHIQRTVSVECVRDAEEDPSLPGIQRQMAGIDRRLVVPWTSDKTVQPTGRQVDAGVVLVPIGAEAQREVSRNGPLLADGLQIQIALLDRVQESIGMVHVTPDLVGQPRRIAGGAQVEIVAVFTRPDNIDFPDEISQEIQLNCIQLIDELSYRCKVG